MHIGEGKPFHTAISTIRSSVWIFLKKRKKSSQSLLSRILAREVRKPPLQWDKRFTLGSWASFTNLGSQSPNSFPCSAKGHGHYNPFVQYQGTLPMADKGGLSVFSMIPSTFCPIKFSIKPTRLGQPRTMIPGMFGFLGRIGQSNMIGSTKEKYGIVQRQPKFALQQNGKIFPCQAVRYVPC